MSPVVWEGKRQEGTLRAMKREEDSGKTGSMGTIQHPFPPVHSPLLLWVTDSNADDKADSVSESVFQTTLWTSVFIIFTMNLLTYMFSERVQAQLVPPASIFSRIPAAGSFSRA